MTRDMLRSPPDSDRKGHILKYSYTSTAVVQLYVLGYSHSRVAPTHPATLAAGWPAGWLAGWLAGWWLAGWTVAGWTAGWLAGWLAGWKVAARLPVTMGRGRDALASACAATCAAGDDPACGKRSCHWRPWVSAVLMCSPRASWHGYVHRTGFFWCCAFVL